MGGLFSPLPVRRLSSVKWVGSGVCQPLGITVVGCHEARSPQSQAHSPCKSPARRPSDWSWRTPGPQPWQGPWEVGEGSGSAQPSCPALSGLPSLGWIAGAISQMRVLRPGQPRAVGPRTGSSLCHHRWQDVPTPPPRKRPCSPTGGRGGGWGATVTHLQGEGRGLTWLHQEKPGFVPQRCL